MGGMAAHLRPIAPRRRGMTIALALIFLVVAALLAVALDLFSRAERSLTYHARDNEIARQAGLSALRAALRHYAALLRDPQGAPFRALAARGADEVSLPAFSPRESAPLAALLADYPGLQARVEARLHEIEPLTLNAPADPREKRGVISLAAHVAWNDVRKTVRERRRFRFSSAAPPVVSRFTLFLPEPDATRINNLDARADGSQEGGGRPLVLVNGEEGDLAANGWIYLGEEPLFLNLARGEEGFGEDFGLPDTITRSLFFPDQDYALLHLNTGFYADAGADPVFRAFPVKSEFKASCLRLFSCPAAGPRATPTLVVGNVWRRYLQAAATSPMRDGKLARIVPMPWVTSPEQIPTDPAFPPFLFLSPDLYQVYMSQAREEPYNRTYDFLASGGTNPPPLWLKKEFSGTFGQVYPLKDAALRIDSAAGEPLFEGRLKGLDLPRALRERVGRVYATVAELLEDRGEGDGAIRLNGVCLVREAAADLAARGPLRVRGAGMIVFERDVRVGDVALEDPARDLVAIASLSGDVTVAGKEVQAAVVAPEGEALLSGGDLKGLLAARRIDPDRLRKGGTLRYDGRFNPSGPFHAATFSLDCAPAPLEYREESR